MLYPEKSDAVLSQPLFENPTAAYRGTPFWAWNCAVTKDLIKEQIAVFRQMGFGGFHVHARTGLETPYLGDEFMQLVSYAHEQGDQQGMLCWLYDEDRFPSGAAGGLVTKYPAYRARHLRISTQRPAGLPSHQEFLQQIQSGLVPKGYFFTAYDIVLENGYLASYQEVPWDTKSARGQLWYVYAELEEPSPWYNGQTYLDTLNPEAVAAFIQTTHERYWKVLGDAFGKTVPAIFTDEPHMTRKSTLSFAESQTDFTMAFTDDVPQTFEQAYGVPLRAVLPELFWELPEGRHSQHRYQYHNHLAQCFAQAFAQTLGQWCDAHHIALTGHFLSERTLYSQTLALGDAMRQYAPFQLPGVDILCDQKELTTLKQAVSVARQQGREGVASELYGVTNWDYDFKGHKLQGDWQAALGVTIRVPHLSFMSMKGEAKRDWPASISYQSPWYTRYAFLEDHFARLNTVLTRGKPIVRVGVIHPIESFWLFFGPTDQTGDRRQELDAQFENLHQWLLYGLMDFDLICEELLPAQCPQAGAPLRVNHMAYDAVIVPGAVTLRSSTLERLEQFHQAGGLLIFMGELPSLADALPSARAQALAAKSVCIPFAKTPLLTALSDMRMIGIRRDNGTMADNLFYQLRQDGDVRWLFLCHVNPSQGIPNQAELYTLQIEGLWKPRVYNTFTGDTQSVSDSPMVRSLRYENGKTVLDLQLFAQDSLLLRLENGTDESFDPAQASKQTQTLVLSKPDGFAMEESNVLLLDRAEAWLDGVYIGEDEMLRMDNRIRRQLGWPQLDDVQLQPWCQPKGAQETHQVRLTITVDSDIEVPAPILALEITDAAIRLNGEAAPAAFSDVDWFTDQSIRQLTLPPLRRGRNVLELVFPFTPKVSLENMFLLGGFGISLSGTCPHITAMPKRLYFGDITRQGLPFYTGNLFYEFTVDFPADGRWMLTVPHFAGAALDVWLDGECCGMIAFSPHQLTLPPVQKGKHALRVRLLNTRYNAFAALHNANPNYKWYGPAAYRTQESEWSESYLVKPVGVLSRVVLIKEEPIQ